MRHIFYSLVESPCVRNVDTLINEQDIMFVMSDVHRCPSFCEPCHDAFTDDDEADRKLRLDLQRYRSSVGKSQRATDIPTHNVFGELKVSVGGNAVSRWLVFPQRV